MLLLLCFPILEIHFLSLQPPQHHFLKEGKGRCHLGKEDENMTKGRPC